MLNGAKFPIGSLQIAGFSQARHHKRKFDAVLTLEDPRARAGRKLRFHRKPAPAQLVLSFEDVDDDTLGVQVATESQVAEAIAFASKHAEGTLLVHCFQGVGRSAAVGLAILADRLGVGNERHAMARLIELRPQSIPNRVVVQLADKVLDREGRLLAALDDWEKETPGIKEHRKRRRALVDQYPSLYAWL